VIEVLGWELPNKRIEQTRGCAACSSSATRSAYDKEADLRAMAR
jgi:hypothetical protein